MKKGIPQKSTFSAWFDAVLKEGEFIDIRYGVKGFIVYRPNSMSIVKGLYHMFESELKKNNHAEALFPLFIPYSSFKKESEHIKGFEDETFMVERAGGEELDEKLIIRPTSETAIYPMYSLWVRSYNDLPLKLFQSVAVYRYETKSTRPLLRGREFLWIETHDLFLNEEEAKAQIMEDLRVASKIYDSIGLSFIITEREPFDRFPGAVESYAYDAVLPTGEVLQIATTHYLGQNFTRPFDVGVLNKEGKRVLPFSTCCGIGISRSLGALIATHGDDHGAIVPVGLGMLDIIIIPIYHGGINNDVLNYATKVRDEISLSGLNVTLDTSELTPGDKFYHWELRGIPIRVEIGEKEVNQNVVTIFRRDNGVRKVVELTKMGSELNVLKEEINRELSNRGRDVLSKALKEVRTKEELLKASKEKSIMLADFCGRKECADEIRNASGGFEIRGRPLNLDYKLMDKCVWCGNKSLRKVIIAKAY